MAKASLIDEFDAFARANPMRRARICQVSLFPEEHRALAEMPEKTLKTMVIFLQARGYLADMSFDGARVAISRHRKGECACGPR